MNMASESQVVGEWPPITVGELQERIANYRSQRDLLPLMRQQIIDDARELGMSWREIARLFNVDVHAVWKKAS